MVTIEKVEKFGDLNIVWYNFSPDDLLEFWVEYDRPVYVVTLGKDGEIELAEILEGDNVLVPEEFELDSEEMCAAIKLASTKTSEGYVNLHVCRREFGDLGMVLSKSILAPGIMKKRIGQRKNKKLREFDDDYGFGGDWWKGGETDGE